LKKEQNPKEKPKKYLLVFIPLPNSNPYPPLAVQW